MQNADQGSAGELNGEGLCAGAVCARFNDAVTSSLAEACHPELDRLEKRDNPRTAPEKDDFRRRSQR